MPRNKDAWKQGTLQRVTEREGVGRERDANEESFTQQAEAPPGKILGSPLLSVSVNLT